MAKRAKSVDSEDAKRDAVLDDAWQATEGGQEICSLDLARRHGIHPGAAYRILACCEYFHQDRMLWWRRSN